MLIGYRIPPNETRTRSNRVLVHFRCSALFRWSRRSVFGIRINEKAGARQAPVFGRLPAPPVPGAFFVLFPRCKALLGLGMIIQGLGQNRRSQTALLTKSIPLPAVFFRASNLRHSHTTARKLCLHSQAHLRQSALYSRRPFPLM